MITSNHPTPFDPINLLLTFLTRRLHNLGTINLFKTKIGAWFFRQMHVMPVDKENFSPAVFRDIQERLSNGHPVTIFPEGRLTTKDDGAIQAFKSGAVLMAYKAGAPLVPVYLHKKDRWYQRQRIVVGEPINIVELVGKLPTKTALAAASAAVHDKELELQSYLESLPIGKKLQKKREKILAKREKKAMKKAKREALSEKSE
jgi:1-acyl-sn-glycerol-3-phosphate acyltransferase